MEKAAVMGALSLYLDFVNLFLFMLRLIGRPQLARHRDDTRRRRPTGAGVSIPGSPR